MTVSLLVEVIIAAVDSLATALTAVDWLTARDVDEDFFSEEDDINFVLEDDISTPL